MGSPGHVHLDPLGGVAGDMFIAAVLDAWPHLFEGAVAAMRAAGLPDDWRVDLLAHDDHVLTGRRLTIESPAAGAHPPTGDFRAIRRRLDDSPLPEAVRRRAVAIFTELAAAEAAVHGVDIDDVHFHEIADWDSVADIVGAAHVIESLGPRTWSSAPLPVGGGRVNTRHGPLPVPAPATARLLAGMAVIDDGIPGERVTPTGAAILRHLAVGRGLPPTPLRLAASGHGFGTRRLPGISNALRLLAYDPDEAARQTRETVAVLVCTIDDQTPEELAAGLDALRTRQGVLEVTHTPCLGKKGRMAARVEVLARREALDAAIDAVLTETTTLGVRWHLDSRAALARAMVAVPGDDGGEVTVKVVTRPDGARTAKADIDTVAPARGHAGRARRRRRAEAAALEDSE